MSDRRPALILIHGAGGSYAEALDALDTLHDVPACYHDGAFHLPKSQGLLLRRLFFQTDDSPLIQAIQKDALSHLLNSCFEPGIVDLERSVAIHERRLLDEFPKIGFPVSPGARWRRARELRNEAATEMAPFRAALDAIRPKLPGTSEADIPNLIHSHATPQVADSLIHALGLLRGFQETGGDLDTVASAVLYAHWLRALARDEGRPFEYGIDYRFVFVNYHEGTLHLAKYAPGDLYMADMPIGALPDFEPEIHELARQDVSLICFEDHHPFSQDQIESLERLRVDGYCDRVAMSGGLDGAELPDDQHYCAADMVYNACVRGRPWDTPAMAELQRLAHAEDWVTDRTDTSKLFTALIKGGLCKVEMAQQILTCTSKEDLHGLAAKLGWDKTVDEWEHAFDEIQDKLWANVVCMRIPRANCANPDAPLPMGDATASGPALDPASDVPMPVTQEGPLRDHIQILMVLAYRPQPGAPKVPVGRVQEYFARECPEADYVFYCWGSNLMVARRLNQADLTFNLGALMPFIGGPGDGGHAGAAVCRPDSSPAYPTELLGRVSSGGFRRFATYMARRLEAATGCQVCELRNLSRQMDSEQMARSSRRLLLLAAAALIVGFLLVAFHPGFDAEAIEGGNAGLYQDIAPGDSEHDTEADERNDERDARFDNVF